MDYFEDHDVVYRKPPRVATRSTVFNIQRDSSPTPPPDNTHHRSHTSNTSQHQRSQSNLAQRPPSATQQNNTNEPVNNTRNNRLQKSDSTPMMGHRVRSNSIISINKSTNNDSFFLTNRPSTPNNNNHEQIQNDDPVHASTRVRRTSRDQPPQQGFLEDKDVNLKCIFSVNNKSADVELTNKKIAWSFISQSVDDMKKKYYGDSNDLVLSRVFCVEPKRSNNTVVTKALTFDDRFNIVDDLTVEGFKLHIFKRIKPNHYDHQTVSFVHPHRQTCKTWITSLYEATKSFKIEKRLLVLLNPYSGGKQTRSYFNSNILPILELVNFKIDVIEFHDDSNLADSLYRRKILIQNYYGILIMAGDSGITSSIRDIVQRLTHEDSESTGNSNQLRTPLCIIPVGTTNLIANSIYGSNSWHTPLMHLIFGNCMNIDIASVYTTNQKLVSYTFGLSAGFGANIVRYASKFSRLGTNRIQTAIARGATKSAQRPIEVEIKYLPCTDSNPNDKSRCLRGCSTCNNPERKINPVKSKSLDEVKQFNNFNNDDNNFINGDDGDDDMIEDEKRHRKWKTISGSFIHLEILVNSMVWDQMCTGGLSKYGHLADGHLDLVLVNAVPKADFKRFLKRHTNRKNPFELPFVQAIRAKEIKIKIISRIRESLATTNSLSNDQSTHISYNPDSISDDSDEDDNNRFNSKNKARRVEDAQDEDDINEHKSRMRLMRQISASSEFDPSRQPTDQNKIKTQQRHIGTKSDSENNYNHIPRPEASAASATLPASRKSSFSRSKSYFKKKSQSIVNRLSSSIENLRNSAASPMANIPRVQKSNTFKTPHAWNMDWNLCAMPYLHVKCSKQFLPVFAVGLDADTSLDEATTSCLLGLPI